jgi:hypothetical protein
MDAIWEVDFSDLVEQDSFSWVEEIGIMEHNHAGLEFLSTLKLVETEKPEPVIDLDSDEDELRGLLVSGY